jgi:hypothetical protein
MAREPAFTEPHVRPRVLIVDDEHPYHGENPMKLRSLLTTAAIAALVGAGAVAATSTAASARTVCNNYGDCWHESNQYDYPSVLGVRFHSNRWHSHDHRYNWRDNHDGRGYYRQGVWIAF